jgi:hypothetical protein
MGDEAEVSGALLAGRGRRELEERKFKAFDELSHECEITSIDRVSWKVIVRIPEEGDIRDHECWETCIPERGWIN